MNFKWARCLALALCLGASAAQAQQTGWRVPPSYPGPSAAIGKPVVIARTPGYQVAPPPTAPAPAPPAGHAASLCRPVAIAQSAHAPIQQTTFSTRPNNPLAPIVRGVSGDNGLQPLPSGPMEAPRPTWRRAGDLPPATPHYSENNYPPPNHPHNNYPPPNHPQGNYPPPNYPPPNYPPPNYPPPNYPPQHNGPPMPPPSHPPAPIVQTNPPAPPPGPPGPPMPPPPPQTLACPPGPVMPCPASDGPAWGSSLPVAPQPIYGGVSYGAPVSQSYAGPACTPVTTGYAVQGLGGAILGDRSNHCFAVSLEYLLWRTSGDPTPPLVTSGSPAAGPLGAVLGADPAATVLFGGNDLGNDFRSGARASAVWWFSDEHCWGIDVGGFYLSDQRDTFSVFSMGNPVLGRPIIDFTPRVVDINNIPTLIPNPRFGLSNIERVANLAGANGGALAGGVDITRKSTLWGFEANLRRCFCTDPAWNVDMFFGYRQLGLDESLSITENLAVLSDLVGTDVTGRAVLVTPAGTTFLINDKFVTSNRFYGAQIGADVEYGMGRWFVGMRAKVGLGATNQRVEISGFRQTNGGLASPGGLLALQGTNIGTYSRTVFGVVPELGLNVGYQLTDHLRIFGGYNCLYWNNVQRPGRAIDLGVNRNYQASPGVGAPDPNPARPAFHFNGSSFWAHGLTAGLELRF